MTSNPAAKIDRKALVKELAAEIGADVKYLGAPTMAYKVGPYTVNKDASISGDDLKAIWDFLIRHDYIHQEPATEAESTQDNLETETVSDTATAEIIETKVSVPISELTPTAITNLLRLVFAKQKLIEAMTHTGFIFIDEEVIDLLNDEKPDAMESISELVQSEAKVNMIRGIELDADKLTFTFPFDGNEPTNWASYAKLFTAMIERAKAAQHINAKRIEPTESEMKYYCNSLLNQLGFGGADFKADRGALLGHLTGYAAFKSADKMEAHKTKFSERRKAARLAAQDTNNQPSDTEQAEDDLKTDCQDSNREVMA